MFQMSGCATTSAAPTGFRRAHKLLDRIVQVVAGFRMPNPAAPPDTVPMINLNNLKHAIVPLQHAHVGGDASKRFLHVTLDAGNDTPGLTAEVRKQVAELLGYEVDAFVRDLPELASVTVHVQDIDRDRGYSTTGRKMAEGRKKNARGLPAIEVATGRPLVGVSLLTEPIFELNALLWVADGPQLEARVLNARRRWCGCRSTSGISSIVRRCSGDLA